MCQDCRIPTPTRRGLFFGAAAVIAAASLKPFEARGGRSAGQLAAA